MKHKINTYRQKVKMGFHPYIQQEGLRKVTATIVHSKIPKCKSDVLFVISWN